MKILTFAITATVMFLASGVVSAQDHKLDISLETGPNHVRNLAIVKLAEELEEASGGRLEVRVFLSSPNAYKRSRTRFNSKFGNETDAPLMGTGVEQLLRVERTNPRHPSFSPFLSLCVHPCAPPKILVNRFLPLGCSQVV